VLFFFSSRRRHTRWPRDWSSDVCSSDLNAKRMSAAAEILDRVPLSINVDHHHDNTRFATVDYVAADASSTGEIVRDLLRELDVRSEERRVGKEGRSGWWAER